MADYASLVGDAVLRQRTRDAENSARIQSDLANKIRSEFLSNMSHELRTPLNTVMGFAKIINDHSTRKLKDEEIVEYAGIIHDAASHLLSVINDVLDISKIQSGRYILDSRDVDLDEILSACVLAHRPIAEQAGQVLHADIANDLLTVRGDPAKLRKIFNNVLSNALKFTPTGGTVTLTAKNHGSDRIEITIADSGVGMTADDITVALTPFGQVDGSHSRWREGTGLGLPIANALTLMHEGQLNIASTPNQGTRVMITMPSSDSVLLSEAHEALIDATF